MSTGLVWSNVLAYSLQIGLVIGLGAVVPAILRIRMPRARLLFWQVLLIACLALPWIRSWRQEVVSGTAEMTTVVMSAAPVSGTAPVSRPIPFVAIALGLLLAGILVRLGCLAVGLFRLRGYRRRGEEIPRELRIPGTADHISIMLSEDVAGPVTFGWRSPVILLPSDFPSLDAGMRDAILCHELMHVERRDWLFTIAEELLRSVLWFHPAIWWVIGEIQLAREQSVDESVIETTRAKGAYVDALLLMAGAGSGESRAELAPAPMFLRKRHLKRRLMEMMNGVRMTKISGTRLACLMGTAIMMISGVCWLATGAFPLAAAPQFVEDAAGVAVNTSGLQLMHRSSVPYPAVALAKGIEGTVVAQVKLDGNGEVEDAAILSGPDELRKSVLQSVLAWHFDTSGGSTTRTVTIRFVRPAGRTAAPPPAPSLPSVAAPAQSRPPATPRIARIVVTGLSDELRDSLLSKLTVHAGDSWSPAALLAVNLTAKSFDSHLSTMILHANAGDYEIRISLPAAFGAASSPGPVFRSGFGAVAEPGIFSVGNGTTAPTLIGKVEPQYTEEARAAKYSGAVMLSIVVGPDGKAQDPKVIKSLGMGLDEKAIEAVQQWVFRPATNHGEPVKVRAQIEVNFRLL